MHLPHEISEALPLIYSFERFGRPINQGTLQKTFSADSDLLAGVLNPDSTFIRYSPNIHPLLQYTQQPDRFFPAATSRHAASASASPRVGVPRVLAALKRFEVFGSSAPVFFAIYSGI